MRGALACLGLLLLSAGCSGSNDLFGEQTPDASTPDGGGGQGGSLQDSALESTDTDTPDALPEADAAGGSAGSDAKDSSAEPDASDAKPDAADAGDAADSPDLPDVHDAPDAQCLPLQKPCNGVCVSTSDTATGCAQPGCAPCKIPGAQAICLSNGACAMGACSYGYQDCNHDPADGCEADLLSDPAHCGSCLKACSPLNATPACQNGTCILLSCNTGFGNCDQIVDNGCETALATSPWSCGACNSPCALAHATPGCAGGVCNIASCASGWGDCDAVASNGCEHALLIDAANCGACGHDCLGAMCVNGLCQPITVASGQQTPWSIALDTSFVYWDNRVNPGGVYRTALGGGAVAALATGQAEPEGLAVDGTHAYWANFSSGEIMAVPLSGGTPAVLATGQSGPAGIAVWNGDVFWTNWNGGTVMRLASGAPLATLVTGQSNPHRITTDGTTVWFTNFAGGNVRKVPVVGGAASTMATSTGPIGITYDATNLYWTDASSIKMMPRAGGAIMVLASGLDHPVGLAVDGTHVYFTCSSSTGSVRRVPIAGGTAATLVSGLYSPLYLVMDGTAVYWTMPNLGTVMKVAK